LLLEIRTSNSTGWRSSALVFQLQWNRTGHRINFESYEQKLEEMVCYDRQNQTSISRLFSNVQARHFELLFVDLVGIVLDWIRRQLRNGTDFTAVEASEVIICFALRLYEKRS